MENKRMLILLSYYINLIKYIFRFSFEEKVIYIQQNIFIYKIELKSGVDIYIILLLIHVM